MSETLEDVVICNGYGDTPEEALTNCTCGKCEQSTPETEDHTGCKCKCHYPPFSPNDIIPCNKCANKPNLQNKEVKSNQVKLGNGEWVDAPKQDDWEDKLRDILLEWEDEKTPLVKINDFIRQLLQQAREDERNKFNKALEQIQGRFSRSNKHT